MCLMVVKRRAEQMKPAVIGYKVVRKFERYHSIGEFVEREYVYHPLCQGCMPVPIGCGWGMNDEMAPVPASDPIYTSSMGPESCQWYQPGVHAYANPYDAIRTMQRVMSGDVRMKNAPVVIEVFLRGPIAEGVEYFYSISSGLRMPVVEWEDEMRVYVYREMTIVREYNPYSREQREEEIMRAEVFLKKEPEPEPVLV